MTLKDLAVGLIIIIPAIFNTIKKKIKEKRRDKDEEQRNS